MKNKKLVLFIITLSIGFVGLFITGCSHSPSDLAGNASVTTGKIPDITNPTVSSTSPVNNAINVPVNPKKSGAAADTIAPINPANGAIDVLTDTITPAVISTSPDNKGINVPINQKISVTFSEAMDPATINKATFMVIPSNGTETIRGTVSYAGSTATFASNSNLAYNTLYTVTITSGVKDLAGNTLTNNYVWSFTTTSESKKSSISDTTAPIVISTFPVKNKVPTNQKISVTFSEAMDTATINMATFSVQPTGSVSVIIGRFAYAGSVVTFTPDIDFSSNTLYTAMVTTGAKDLAGNTLASNYVWTFITGAGPDTTAPTVISTSPLNNAINVPINQKISVTFSEAMETTTIFSMTGPRGSITGKFAYTDSTVKGSVVTFTPDSNLEFNTSYTVTITAARAKDLVGNTLASSYVWTFRTGTLVSGAVSLHSAGNFVVLAGSTITNTGFTTLNNGDIGLSPNNSVTGFPPGIINGMIFTGIDSAAYQAKIDLTTAYKDAVGRSGAVTVAENIGGKTLTPGLYKSTSTLEISSGTLTLDAQGNANAVFIFQIYSAFTTGDNSQVVLKGNAKAANIYWQVGSSATLGGTASVFEGNILAAASITLNNGAILHGRALAQTGAVTLYNNTITVPTP